MSNVSKAMEYAASLDREAREKGLSEFTYDSLGPSYKHVPYPPDPPKEWVGLTGAEVNHIFAANVGYPERMMQEVEAILKEKNCG